MNIHFTTFITDLNIFMQIIKMRTRLILAILIGLSFLSQAQSNLNNTPLSNGNDSQRTNLQIPNIPGFITLTGDFHSHTIFSDGEVWPTVRILEAWQEGLDVIAITDHLEYKPHKSYLQADHNTSYEIAKIEAKKKDILLVKGSEITRSMPPGHLNALFITDANALDKPDWKDAFQEVSNQDALMIWNHPGWKAQQPDTTKLFDIHKELIATKKISGIEVANYTEWYPIALDWCIKNHLAVFANSDIHEPIQQLFDLSKTHRPMTLLFVRERSLEGVKEAIKAARTVAWFENQLAGPEELLAKLVKESIKIGSPYYRTGDEETDFKYFEVTNLSDFQFEFVNESKTNGAPKKFSLQPRKSIVLTIYKNEKSLKCTIVNIHTGVKSNLAVDLIPRH